MFCPQCGLNQEERRFCTRCGANLSAVSQALRNPSPGPVAGTPPYLPPSITPYEMERQREYAKGMKLLLVGGAFLAFNILRFILTFGHSSISFFGFVGLVLFAVGLSKVLSWRQIAGVATHAVLQSVPPPVPQQPTPTPTPQTAQFKQTPHPVFSAVPPGTRTDELEPVRRTHSAPAAAHTFAPSITEDDTRQLPSQQAN